MTGFTPEIRDAIRKGTQDSAAVLVPLIVRKLFPEGGLTHVIDVGCGEGWWVSEFARRYPSIIEKGLALGIDHPDTEPDPANSFVGTAFARIDLTQPIHEQATFGDFQLAISLEVAEHLPHERGPGFVADLCNLAPLVVFSAAIPGQGGTGHLNEQWPSYWAALFEEQGWECSGAFRWDIWEDDRVENWYRQNLLVAWAPDVNPPAYSRDDAPPRNVVHPVLWDHYRATHP